MKEVLAYDIYDRPVHVHDMIVVIVDDKLTTYLVRGETGKNGCKLECYLVTNSCGSYNDILGNPRFMRSVDKSADMVLLQKPVTTCPETDEGGVDCIVSMPMPRAW